MVFILHMRYQTFLSKILGFAKIYFTFLNFELRNFRANCID